MNEIKIGDRTIGPNAPCFVIAEAGVNHNGSVEMAEQLIVEAKRAGADCVKFQTFKAEQVITQDAPKADYQLKTTDPAESQIDMLRKLELNFDAYKTLIELCAKEDIVFFSTPYNRDDVDFLDELGAPAFKMASIHVAEPAFLRYAASKGKPLIVSTGMATLAEVDEAVRTLREAGNEQFVLLQCTTNYPSRPEDANLLTIPTMRDAFDALVGYSDHTQSETACLVSIGLGACVIEKHFSLDKSLPGPDQSSSADPAEFAQLMVHIREAEAVLGSPQKGPMAVERVNARGMRRSIVAKQDIAAGATLTEEMLAFKRPGTGLRPALLDEIVGKRTRRALPGDTLLNWSDLED